ncbi:MAG: amidophosphoribosyltransferase [Candidatus Aenigmarchaeota archaeon]|nr:amidophosphoribosyltransferase [Candidatus Aenigmarchaeota archaeon]
MNGIFGVASKRNCSELLFYGTDYHSHLGTEIGGLAVLGKEIKIEIRDISSSQFKTEFYEAYKKMEGNLGIGVISAKDKQPILQRLKLGPFAICTNGFIENAEELVSELMDEEVSFTELTNSSVNHTELAAKLIDQGNDFVDGIKKMYERIEGSISLLLLSEKDRCIYCASDRFPLVIGERGEDWAVTSETCAFPNLGFKTFKYLQPREISAISESGIEEGIKKAKSATKKTCAFLWIYGGYPASDYYGVNVEVVRERCGRALARDDKKVNLKADLVCGVPDSGIAHGIGYSMESGIPFRRPLVKYTPGWDRSYTPLNQEDRDKIAYYKIIPIPEMIKNLEIVITEDSIVRGTQLRKLLEEKVWPHEPRMVHIRVACPPLMFPCKYNLSTRSVEELAARRAIRKIEGKDIENVDEYLDPNSRKYKDMIEEIKRDIARKHADSMTLKYQKLDDMVKAIGLPKEQLCLYCWTGKG